MRNPGEGFYLYSFKAPETFKAKRVLLHFDGVWSSAVNWATIRRSWLPVC